MKMKRSTLKLIIGLIVVILLVVAAVFALPGVVKGAWYLIKLFMPFILAYLFALVVNPIAVMLQRRFKLPRGWSALIGIVFLLGVVGGIVAWVIYTIVDEIRSLYTHIPELYNNMLSAIEVIKIRLAGIYEILPTNVQQALAEVGTQFSELGADLINSKSVPFVFGAGSFAKALPKALVSSVVFILSSFFMISDFDRVKAVVKKPFQKISSEKLALFGEQVKSYLGAYVKAQGTIMSIVFVVIFIGLSILKVEYALLIALGTALLDALPFFGSGAVLWPWALVSFITGDIKQGIGNIVIYIVIIALRQFIEPKIVSQKIGTNPILTLMSMYLGYRIIGLGGLILGPIIMMLVISMYKAHMFDKPKESVCRGYEYVKHQCGVLKSKINNFWESE